MPPAPSRTRLRLHAPGFTMPRLRVLAGLVTAVVVLVPAVAAAAPLEDFAGYQPQRRCNPTAKPGTVALSVWLMRKYPGSGSLGISRACNHGGTSEHKEGRAFDWAVDATSKRDRGYVKDLFATLFAPDAEGSPAALARRMGIMYLIWDDHIYASYRQFEKKPYLSPGCRSVKRCSVTLRHRNHVHISLSRAGGRGDTSWYHRDDPTWQSPVPVPPTPVPPTTPVPPPPVTTPEPPPAVPVGRPVKGELKLNEKKPFARVKVPLDGSTFRSRWKLRQGKSYKLTVAGLVGLGAPDQVADATCVWSSAARGWVGTLDAATARATGTLDVKVNGKARFGDDCRDSHVYTTTFVPRRSKPLRLRLASSTTGATGRIVLTVSRRKTDVAAALPTYPTLAPAPTARASVRGLGLLAETLQVPAAATEPVSTQQELEAGARYRVTVSGVVDLGAGVQSDGQCIGIGGRWFTSASLDPRTPGDDHGNLYLDGVPFAGSPTDCGTQAHVGELTAGESRQLQLALWDPLGPAGNTGALTVTVQRLSGLPEPRQARGERPEGSTPWTQARDWFPVALDNPGGTVSTMRVRKGERVTVVVGGTYTSHGVTADATCVATAAGWAQRDPALALEQDPLELWVDGELLTWQPTGAATGACSVGHAYTTTFVATKSGPVRLAVMDLDHRDDTGALEVTLVRS